MVGLRKITGGEFPAMASNSGLRVQDEEVWSFRDMVIIQNRRLMENFVGGRLTDANTQTDLAAPVAQPVREESKWAPPVEKPTPSLLPEKPLPQEEEIRETELSKPMPEHKTEAEKPILATMSPVPVVVPAATEKTQEKPKENGTDATNFAVATAAAEGEEDSDDANSAIEIPAIKFT